MVTLITACIAIVAAAADSNNMDGVNLTIGASVASAIVAAVATYWRTKQPVHAEIKQKIDVDIADKFATREQLKSFEDRLNTFATKDEIKVLHNEIDSVKTLLISNDKADEERTRGVHKRIDNLLEVMLDCAKDCAKKR
jgi:hypothetical protein